MVREQMQGVCLYPLTVEKQTALRKVLEDLIINTGYARTLRLHQVMARPVCYFLKLVCAALASVLPSLHTAC